MRKLIAVLCLLLAIPALSYAEESDDSQTTEPDTTVAEAAAANQHKMKACNPTTSTAVGIVEVVDVGTETPVMISPISIKSTYTLSKGAPVLWGSKIVTTANSRVHIILSDNTTLTVGPNAEVKMDEHVFNPCASFSGFVGSVPKGVFRFIGGKINTPEPVQITAPQSSSGIRG